jgi:hypothetical protein
VHAGTQAEGSGVAFRAGRRDLLRLRQAPVARLRPVGVQRGTRAPGQSAYSPSWLTGRGRGSALGDVPRLSATRRQRSVNVRPMTSAAPACPECRQPMKSGGLLLCGREDDNRRACRALWRCAGQHFWWNWADRSAEPLEVCPVPELFH